MIDELHTASGLLGEALRRYHDACSAIANNRNLNDIREGIHQGTVDVILRELDGAHSHKDQLQQSILTISQFRNTVPSISPIAVLPLDVLSQILGTVAGMQPAYPDYLGDGDSYETPRLNYPETLAHVCSRWRRLVLDMRWLWARIDVPIELQGASLGLLTRAKAFAARADPLLLDLNIHSGTDNGTVVDTTLDSFYAAIAPRIRSLNVALLESLDDQHLPVLEEILKNCKPGALNRLIIRNDDGMHTFEIALIESFEAPEREDDCYSLRIRLSQQRLDECFLPVRVLELGGVYFHWNSQVYRNLTEFYFFNSSESSFITESQLGQILRASPGLRVLSLFIRPITPASCAVVCLNELEVLNLGPMDKSAYQILFRLISPGPKLLRVALNMGFDAFNDFKVSLKAFLSRSKAQQLRFNFQEQNPYIPPEAFELFKSMSDLELLDFSYVRLSRRGNGARLQQESDSTVHRPQLKTLYLACCEIDLDYLQRVTTILSVQTLVLSGCSVRLFPTMGGYIKAEAVDQELAKLVPALKFIPTEKRVTEWTPWR